MADVDEAFANRLTRQGWSLYALGMAFIILRMYGRARRLGGISHYQADDYLEILAGILRPFTTISAPGRPTNAFSRIQLLFTLLVASLNIIIDNGGSNLYPPEQFPTFTPSDIQARITGSKIVLVSEQAMLNLIYVLKACVLILYTRLTLGLAAQRFVRYLSIYVAVGWTATQIMMFTACRPFSGYWAVPPPDPQCATYEQYAILQAVFNISSDVLMLLVPLPLVFRMEIAWRQKIVLIFIFSLGVCVIVAALLTKIFNLGDPYSPNYMLWYIREASVAVYVSNLPLVWPLLREWFPWLRSLKAVGVLPTPRTVGRTKAVNGSTGGVTQSVSQPPPVMSMVRRDTFEESATWLNADDLELQNPSRALRPSSSQRYMLEGEDDDLDSSPLGREKGRKRRSSLPEAFLQGRDSEAPSPRRQTMELDLERGLYSCFGPGQGLYPVRSIDFGPTKGIEAFSNTRNILPSSAPRRISRIPDRIAAAPSARHSSFVLVGQSLKNGRTQIQVSRLASGAPINHSHVHRALAVAPDADLLPTQGIVVRVAATLDFVPDVVRDRDNHVAIAVGLSASTQSHVVVCQISGVNFLVRRQRQVLLAAATLREAETQRERQDKQEKYGKGEGHEEKESFAREAGVGLVRGQQSIEASVERSMSLWGRRSRRRRCARRWRSGVYTIRIIGRIFFGITLFGSGVVVVCS
ncbi:hypothetical protein ColTof3_04950 [Colletotrichum tofieldiae]|nr:hypothetical protein ColTof3_04950 [Colletotrichum tofieldiae]